MREKTYKLFDSEIKVMKEFWRLGECRAADVCKAMQEKYGWKYGSTYSAIEKCIEKGCLERIDPGYICRPAVSKKQIYIQERRTLLEKFFDLFGGASWSGAAFNDGEALDEFDRARIDSMFDEFDKETERLEAMEKEAAKEEKRARK